MEILLRTPKQTWPLVLMGVVLAFCAPFALRALPQMSGAGWGAVAQYTLLSAVACLAMVRAAVEEYKGGQEIWFLLQWTRPAMVAIDLLFFVILLVAGSFALDSVLNIYDLLFRTGTVNSVAFFVLFWQLGWLHLLLLTRASVQFRLSGFATFRTYEPMVRKTRRPKPNSFAMRNALLHKRGIPNFVPKGR